MFRLTGRKGQGVIGEHVFLLVLVSIAIVAMTVYVRRALQARYRDGNRQIYLKASGVLGKEVLVEYEPYYVNTAADVDSGSVSKQAMLDGVMSAGQSSERNATSVSTQVPF